MPPLDADDETITPLVRELRPAPDLLAAFQRLSRRPHCLFLDSALRHRELGRYSFLAADPFDYFEMAADGGDALGMLADRSRAFASPRLPELPPFQGGAAGLLSYDLHRSLERIDRARFDEFGAPALAMGLYDVVLACDHVAGRAWIVSQGFPETAPAARHRRARQRLDQFTAWLCEPPAASGGEFDAQPRPMVQPEQLAPQFSVARRAELTSNFSPDGYREAIRRVVEYIHAGDVFQVNLSQRLLYPQHDHPVELYLRLRTCNPAPFAGYFDLGQMQVLSASPERFVRVTGGQVETRPIKGTRHRWSRPEADLFTGDELRQSEKDRAENVMIVDLMRNDLSRVCRPESVLVTQLCEVESYQYVQHLVSAVCGELAPDRTPIDLLAAAFPGGSITGAPKVRAMQIIAEIEPTARGAYCGSLGYLGFGGALDLNILIRTITAGRGWLQLPVGGGIVAQSAADDEYEETWHKARGLVQAL